MTTSLLVPPPAAMRHRVGAPSPSVPHHRATPAPARIVAFSHRSGGLFAPLIDQLTSSGARLVAMPLRTLSPEWFDRYANSFDAALIDADFMGHDSTMIDFSLRLRHFAPDLPIILASTRVAAADYSTERMAICDVTLRAPLTSEMLVEALAIAVDNHDHWHEVRFGRMQSR